MKSPVLTTLLLLIGTIVSAQLKFYQYPPFARSNFKEDKFGVTIANPYKSFETINSLSTKTWLDGQEKLIDFYRRSYFTEYMTCQNSVWSSTYFKRWHYLPHKERPFYYTVRASAVKLAPTIWYKENSKYDYTELCPTEVLQQDKEDHLFIRDVVASPDLKYAAVVISHSGVDWLDIHIRDIKGKRFLPENIKWAKFNDIIWGKDGFFYSRFDAPKNGDMILGKNTNHRMLYHKLGEPVSKDKLILAAQPADITNIWFEEIDDSSNILIMYYNRMEGDKKVTVVGYMHKDSIEGGVKEFIIAPYDGSYPFNVIGKNGNAFVVKSFYKAPKGKIMLYDPTGINKGSKLIEEFSQNLRTAYYLDKKLFTTYFDKGKVLPIVFDDSGRFLKKIDIPLGLGMRWYNHTIGNVILYNVSSFNMPPRIFGLNLHTLETLVYDGETAKLDYIDVVVKVVNYTSDGVSVPMYILQKINSIPTEKTPVLIHAPDFNGSVLPRYDGGGFAMFIEEGGIVAVPMIRGCGDLGEDWHKAGTKLNKQQSVNDFINAAEYLIASRYTSAGNIAIHGESGGGFVVAAAMVQRPELFKVVAAEAGIYDPVNFSKYSNSLQYGRDELGDPDDSLDFLNLYNLSPLHALKKDVEYPATFIRTGSNDDHTAPIQAYKFIAALQNDTKEKIYPYLLYQIEDQGHYDENTEEDAQCVALMYAFIFKNLGIDIMEFGK